MKTVPWIIIGFFALVYAVFAVNIVRDVIRYNRRRKDYERDH